jgi:hypothetical protein
MGARMRSDAAGCLRLLQPVLPVGWECRSVDYKGFMNLSVVAIGRVEPVRCCRSKVGDLGQFEEVMKGWSCFAARTMSVSPSVGDGDGHIRLEVGWTSSPC